MIKPPHLLRYYCVWALGVFLSVLCLQSPPLFAQEDSAADVSQEIPLSCRYDKAANRISCEVLKEKISVSDAKINDGACRSPTAVFESKKWMIAQMTGQDISTLKDFRGDYKRGNSFSLYADRGCAVYKYSLTIDDRDWEFK